MLLPSLCSTQCAVNKKKWVWFHTLFNKNAKKLKHNKITTKRNNINNKWNRSLASIMLQTSNTNECKADIYCIKPFAFSQYNNEEALIVYLCRNINIFLKNDTSRKHNLLHFSWIFSAQFGCYLLLILLPQCLLPGFLSLLFCISFEIQV